MIALQTVHADPNLTASVARSLASARASEWPQGGPERVVFWSRRSARERALGGDYLADVEWSAAPAGAIAWVERLSLWLAADVDPAIVAGVVADALRRGRPIN